MKNLLALICLIAVSTSAQAAERTVIMVLFDGFAPAMIEAAETPNLDRIRAEGSWTHNMKPVFPTISLTNHTSYVTGCWPGTHGIVSNYFHDPEKGYFHGSRDKDWRLACPSVWETAEEAGLPAAALGFAGLYSSADGPTATHVSDDRSWAEAPDDPGRTDQVIALLNSQSPDRPRVIAAYFKGPDDLGHWKGTIAPETIAAAEAADREIGRLMAAIDALPEDREAALFIAADHSMVDVTTYFNIGRVMNKNDIDGKYSSDGAHAYIYLDDPADKPRVIEALGEYDMLSVYGSEDFPDYAHLGTSGRAGDILIVVDQPYWIADASEFPAWARYLGLTLFWPETIELSSGIKATHGYPPEDTNMGTMFYAWGEGVRGAHEIGEMNMIDATPTALQLLGLEKSEEASGVVRAEMLMEE